MNDRGCPAGHAPRLHDFPPLDRRRLMEGLLRRARLAASAHPAVLALIVHGELAGDAGAAGAAAELMAVVDDEELDRYRSGEELREEFSDLPIEVRIEVESRTGFRERSAAGDPDLRAIRDHAVVLTGALPLADLRAW